jgi:mono/diheme cytochrome c family protein
VTRRKSRISTIASRLASVPVLLLCVSSIQAADPGSTLYMQHCSVCHQPDGKGIPGFFPPLAGNPRVTAEDAETVQEYLRRIIFGYHGGLIVDKKVYSGRMPPIGYVGRINDSELLDLINYQRTAWGNDARPVTFEELAEARRAGSDPKQKSGP